jgi:hypothetical protein
MAPPLPLCFRRLLLPIGPATNPRVCFKLLPFPGGLGDPISSFPDEAIPHRFEAANQARGRRACQALQGIYFSSIFPTACRELGNWNFLDTKTNRLWAKQLSALPAEATLAQLIAQAQEG